MTEKITAQLESRIEISDGLAVFRFALESDFIFEPGQYATLWLTHGGRTLGRPYTIASSPSEKRHVEFYINLVSQGKLTPSMWEADVIEGLKSGDPGTAAAISGPKGRFVLDPNDDRDLVFVASGTGLAPFVSMLRKLNEDCDTSPEDVRRMSICLIHGVSYPSHLGYRREIERIAAEGLKNPCRKVSLVYLPTISRPFMDTTWRGLTGRAETILECPAENKPGVSPLQHAVKALLASFLRPESHAVYVCGHPGTVDVVAANLSRRGFSVDTDIKREKYYP